MRTDRSVEKVSRRKEKVAVIRDKAVLLWDGPNCVAVTRDRQKEWPLWDKTPRYHLHGLDLVYCS